MAKRYLDPKADVTFKKVFGEHKNLIISFLNALLPLDEGRQIESIEYLPVELVPRTPIDKDTSVDVRCEETGGRQFIVEMQMNWRASFKQRVLFNASKAYVRQLDKGEVYNSLQPVYSLNLVNDTFEPDIDDYYHYYRLVHYLHSDKVLEGLHLVFVELPKFKAKNLVEKKMQVLWLRFLTEIGEATREVPQDLIDDPHVNQALEIVEESAYNEAEMYAYDRFWDYASRQATIAADWKMTETKFKAAMAELDAANAKLDETNAKLSATNAELNATNAKLSATNAELNATNAELNATNAELNAANAELSAANAKLDEATEKLHKTVRSLKEIGMPVDQIAKVTGLAAAEIETL